MTKNIEMRRTGEIYHFIGFHEMIAGGFVSRESYLDNKIEFKNDEGSYRFKDREHHGFIISVVFNQNVNAMANPFNHDEIRIKFPYWHKIGRPLTIERVMETTGREIFINPENFKG